MAVEIERKFLLKDDSWRAGVTGTLFRQGYLSRAAERTVRVRIAGEQAFLTIKGKSQGASRAEFEYAIPVADAAAMLELCDGPLIEKNRYCIEHAGFVWEVDEFLGANAGLVVAEVELPSEATQPPLPEWVGVEVTSDARYYNSRLSEYPYSGWGVVPK